MIYLDNAATTKVFETAIDAANTAMREEYFNPNATYKYGVAAKKNIELARRTIADAVGAKPEELVFTSCATESNNWVFARGIKNAKGNVVISAGEHSSVYEAATSLKNRGVDVRIAPFTSSGTVDENALYGLVDADTCLVSVIHVSNETGVINPIKRICKGVKARAPRALFHSDGVQAFLKCAEPLDGLGVDFYSASAHKLGAPKGIGLLYIKQGVNVAPFMCGGGQENGLRSGTQNTPYIAAYAAAVSQFKRDSDSAEIAAIRAELAEMFVKRGCKIVGDGENSGYILCVCVPGVKAEILQNLVHEHGIIIGKGAACAGAKRGNRVLAAMGLSPKEIEGCIRISLFCDTARADAIAAAQIISETADKLRSGNVG